MGQGYGYGGADLTRIEMAEYSVEANRSFPAKDYLKRYLDPRADPQGVHEEFLKAYHHFYNNYQHGLNSSTALMLEFGGGPTVYSLISACPYVKEITFTEYSELNRDEILKWRNEEKDSHDWKPYIKYVTEDLEKNLDPLAVVEREKAMRVKIKEIIGCDVMSDNLVENRTTPLFDVIQTNLCLEAVCQSLNEYVEKVKKLKQMLKPGGYLLCIGAKESSWYTCTGSGHKFYVLKMTQKELEECYEKAGLTLKESFTLDAGNHSISTTKAFHFIATQNV